MKSSRVSRIALAGMGLAAGAIGWLAALKVRDERAVEAQWRELERAPTSGGVFREEMVAELPDPARRFFLHAIRPGTPLATRLHWHYTGRMKPAESMPWMDLTADQVLVKERGFVWKARASRGPLFVTAADSYLDSEARMRIKLFGLIPVVNATGPDLARSAMARLLMEGIALPPAFLPGPGVGITALDDARFTVTVDLQGETTPMTVTVDEAGRPTELVLPRWGNLTDDGSYASIPYGVTFDGEETFAGYTIPTRIRGGWWYGTDRYLEVIRLSVDWARFDEPGSV